VATSGYGAFGIDGTLSGAGLVSGVTITATSTSGSAYGIRGDTGAITGSTITARAGVDAFAIFGSPGAISSSTISATTTGSGGAYEVYPPAD
jgi:hypothetical protein